MSIPASGGYTCSLAGPGLFISFEGLDGCGKSTQLQLLAQRLRQEGVEILIAQEPGGTGLGQGIRSLLLDSANTEIRPVSELLLYFASRCQNLEEVILPALSANKVVLCDRFTDATIAYQGYGRGLGDKLVRQIDTIVCKALRPDLTLWLDIEPETSLHRARKRNDTAERDEGRMESETLEFFLRVRAGYAAIHDSEPGRVLRVEADGSIEDVAGQIQNIVLPKISKWSREQPSNDY